MKRLAAAVIGLGLIGTQACTAGSVDEETLEVGDVGQGMCGTVNGVNPMLANLAVSMAKEIRELDPVRDLVIEYSAWVNTGSYTFRNVHANKCLDIENGSSSNGANLRLWDCNGSTAQQFKVESLGNGYYQLKNVASNKCVDVWNFSTANGANIAQYSCNGGDQQRFSLPYTGNSTVTVLSKLSGKAMDGWGWGTSNGTNIAQYAPGGGNNQAFVMTRTDGASVTNGMTRIRLSAAGKERCNANGGCRNTDAILDLQDDAVNSVISQNEFNVTNYRNTLVASYQRQWDWEYNLQMNNPSALPPSHVLTYKTTTNTGACGPHDVFDARKAGCSGSNCLMTNPADINNRLAFFENGNNPFLDFYATASQIGIDPTGTMTSSTTTSSGSCTAASMTYDPTFLSNNKCCSVNGAYGTFKPASFNPAIFLCYI